MTDERSSDFRRWLNQPLIVLPELSSHTKDHLRRVELSPTARDRLALLVAALGFVVIATLFGYVAEAIKANGLTWLAVGLSAAAALLSSSLTVPVLLLLILFALWHRNSSIAALRGEVEELAQNLEALEERMDGVAPTPHDDNSDTDV